ncbi:hypothetical protein BA6E_124184 [Bacteroidales bacterium 6E]|nr:hypothetical protein BA6E_124184 [Bacteroidales bacterium 6E]
MWIVIYRYKNKTKIEMFTLQFIFFTKYECPICMSKWHKESNAIKERTKFIRYTIVTHCIKFTFVNKQMDYTCKPPIRLLISFTLCLYIYSLIP